MKTAVVGSTGFVGGNLLRSGRFAEGFSSSNATEMRGRRFETVVFAAARAEKWRINQDPETDLQHIKVLCDLLESFTTRRLVLISTVDVYRVPIDVDEESPIDLHGLQPYGLHRYELELAARSIHPHTTVVRLPGLFGTGLKKNAIFDLMHDNNVDRIHPDGRIQYYDLGRLADDIDVAIASGLDLVNLPSAPIESARLAREIFGVELGPNKDAPPMYDMRTRHDKTFGGHSGYLTSEAATLRQIRDFVAKRREGER